MGVIGVIGGASGTTSCIKKLIINPITTKTMIASIAIARALSHPVSNPILKMPIQAMNAKMKPMIRGTIGSPTIAVSKAVEMKNTIAYVMGPRAVTNIARVNLTLPAVRILAAIHTGIETIIHRMSRPIITEAAITAISVSP